MDVKEIGLDGIRIPQISKFVRVRIPHHTMIRNMVERLVKGEDAVE